MDAGKWYPLSKLASSISIISYHTLYGSKSNLMLTPRKYKYVEEKKLHLIFRTLHLIKRSRRRGGIKEQDSLFVLRKFLRINNIFDQIKESTWWCHVTSHHPLSRENLDHHKYVLSTNLQRNLLFKYFVCWTETLRVRRNIQKESKKSLSRPTVQPGCQIFSDKKCLSCIGTENFVFYIYLVTWKIWVWERDY